MHHRLFSILDHSGIPTIFRPKASLLEDTVEEFSDVGSADDADGEWVLEARLAFVFPGKLLSSFETYSFFTPKMPAIWLFFSFLQLGQSPTKQPGTKMIFQDKDEVSTEEEEEGDQDKVRVLPQWLWSSTEILAGTFDTWWS